MATEIFVPALGESVVEATVGKWLKKVGDTVVAGEILVELETDKVAIETPAPISGILSQISAKSGEVVRPKASLCFIEPKENNTMPSSSSTALLEEKKEPSQSSGGMPPSPSAMRLMAEKGISSEQVKGSGKRGQILKSDVLDISVPVLSSSLTEIKKDNYSLPQHGQDFDKRVPLSRLRQTIAHRLKDAQNTAAILTTFNEVDMKPVMDLRARYKDIFEKKHGVKLGFMSFFTKAVTTALKEIPVLNAEIDGTDVIYKGSMHVAVAVSTDYGLVVPVVRNADQMSLAGIEKEIGRLGLAARNRQLSLEDMQGGTFTISNGGVYGSLMSTPILNMPQSGILGMHKIQERPVVVEGNIVIRPMMYIALSYDHRIVDGKEAVLFLVRIKEILEDPERLVLDV